MNNLAEDLGADATRAGILNVLMYLDMEDIDRFKDKMTVSDIMKGLSEYYGDDSCEAAFKAKYAGKENLDDAFKDRRRQYDVIVNALAKDPSLGDLIMDNHVTEFDHDDFAYVEGGLSACTFEDSDGNVYFVFRGTGAREWYDNGKGIAGLEPTTEQQEQAVWYFDQVVGNNYVDGDYNIIISGHSKGGNKAQFTTITAEYRDHIDVCYNFDGQGMSSEAIDEFEKLTDYEESKQKMYSFCGDNDYVSQLGVMIIPEDHRYYFETVYDPSIQERVFDEEGNVKDYKFAVMYFHYADAYFNTDGTMSKQRDQGLLSQAIKELALDVDGLAAEDRIHIANLVMSVFQGDKPGIDGDVFTGGEKIYAIASLVVRSPEILKTLIANEIVDGVEGGITWLQQEIEKEIEAFEAGWNDFQEDASEAWEDFQDGALETWDGVCNFFSPYVEEANEFINDSVEVVSDGIEDIKDDIEDGIDAIESVWNDFQGGAEDLWSDIQEGAGDAWNDFQEEASDTWDDVCTFFNPYVEEAKDFVDDSVETVSDGIDDLQEGFENGLEYIESGWNDFQNDAGEVWADVQDGASEAWDDLQEGASNAWDSIWNQFNPEPEKADDDIDEVKDSSSSGSSFLSNIDIAAVASSLQQSISDAWSTLQAKLEEVETVGIYPGMPYNSQYTNVGSFTSSRRGGSGSEVDLYMLTQLSNNLRNLEQSFERSIADILRESNRVIRDTDSDYREYYVQQEIQRIYSTHSKLQRKARSLGEKLERKREALNFALEHYQQVENDIIRSLAY